jgi:hypothetical protein
MQHRSTPREDGLRPCRSGHRTPASFYTQRTEEAQAAHPFASGLGGPASDIAIRVCRRGRPPIYPYYYNPGRPGGYSFFRLRALREGRLRDRHCSEASTWTSSGLRACIPMARVPAGGQSARIEAG